MPAHIFKTFLTFEKWGIPDKKPRSPVFLTFQVDGWAEGHKSSRTTEIYTHVSMKSLKNIKNPLNDFEI